MEVTGFQKGWRWEGIQPAVEVAAITLTGGQAGVARQSGRPGRGLGGC